VTCPGSWGNSTTHGAHTRPSATGAQPSLALNNSSEWLDVGGALQSVPSFECRPGSLRGQAEGVFLASGRAQRSELHRQTKSSGLDLAVSRRDTTALEGRHDHEPATVVAKVDTEVTLESPSRGDHPAGVERQLVRKQPPRLISGLQ